MDIIEAKKAYNAGKRVRLSWFPEGTFISREGRNFNYDLSMNSIFEGEWEIAQEYVDFAIAMSSMCSEEDFYVSRKKFLEEGRGLTKNETGNIVYYSIEQELMMEKYNPSEEDILAKDWVIL